MGIELIYESIYSGLALMDSQLQIWTTFTFALIVAVHLAGDRVGRSLFRLTMGLYGLYATVVILRNISATFQILHYQGLLVEQELEPWPVPRVIGAMIGGGTLLLLVGGTIATLWFVRTTQRASAGETRSFIPSG